MLPGPGQWCRSTWSRGTCPKHGWCHPWWLKMDCLVWNAMHWENSSFLSWDFPNGKNPFAIAGAARLGIPTEPPWGRFPKDGTSCNWATPGDWRMFERKIDRTAIVTHSVSIQTWEFPPKTLKFWNITILGDHLHSALVSRKLLGPMPKTHECSSGT